MDWPVFGGLFGVFFVWMFGVFNLLTLSQTLKLNLSVKHFIFLTWNIRCLFNSDQNCKKKKKILMLIVSTKLKIKTDFFAHPLTPDCQFRINTLLIANNLWRSIMSQFSYSIPYPSLHNRQDSSYLWCAGQNC